MDIEQLQAAGVDVLLSFPKTVFEGLQHARLLDARLGGRNVELLDAMQLRYDALAQRRGRPVPCFVPIWMDPLMTVSGDTFISSALEIAGARNVFSDRERRYPLRADLGQGPAAAPEAVAGRDTRYPRVTLDEVVARGPALVLLPDEPHEFCQADAEVFRALAIPAAKHEQIHFCDGKDLMWYGLRTLEGLTRIAERVDDGRRALLG